MCFQAIATMILEIMKKEGPLEHVKQADHANSTNSEDHIVFTQLTISSENNIEECNLLIKRKRF